MYILQLNQSNLLFTPFYVHKIRFISNKLHPSLTWPALWTSFSFLAPTNPKLLAYIDFIYFATMYILQLNQSNLLFTPFYVHKIQFISNKLRLPLTWPALWTSFLFSHRGSHFLKHHTRLFVVPYGQSDLNYCFLV